LLFLSKLANAVFEIQGHTDSIGSEEYNLNLSKRRAEMVKKYLIEECGIAEDGLLTKGYGEDRPVASNGTKEGRQINRRVELKFLYYNFIQTR
jgi:OOP family OmpA-OmpF porin